MKTESLFFNIIFEAIQSEKLKDLLKNIQELYKEETAKENTNVVQNISADVKFHVKNALDNHRDKFTKKERLALLALSEYGTDLDKEINNEAEKVSNTTTELEYFENVVIPTIEKEYGITISKDSAVYKFIVPNLRTTRSDSEHFDSKLAKNRLSSLFKQIDAANITDDDLIEFTDIHEMNRKMRGKFSFVACFNNNKLIAIVHFLHDGKINYIQSVNHFFRNLKEVAAYSNRFIGVLSEKVDASNKKQIERATNRNIDERLQHADVYNRLRYKETIARNRDNKIIEEVKKNAEEALKNASSVIKSSNDIFNPAIIDIISLYKKLKEKINRQKIYRFELSEINKMIDNLNHLCRKKGE